MLETNPKHPTISASVLVAHRWKTQRNSADEAFGDFTHRVGIPAVEKYMETYKLGSWSTLPDPFAKKLVTTDSHREGVLYKGALK